MADKVTIIETRPKKTETTTTRPRLSVLEPTGVVTERHDDQDRKEGLISGYWFCRYLLYQLIMYSCVRIQFDGFDPVP